MLLLNIICIFLYIIQLSFQEKILLDTPLSNINFSCGYDSDTKTVSEKCCFYPENVEFLPKQYNYIFFDVCLDFKQLVYILSVDIYGINYYEMNNKLYNYLRYVDDDNFSIGFHYLRKVNSFVKINYDYSHITINNLTERKCGDSLISQYEIGAMLLYNIKVIFTNTEDKKNFDNNYYNKTTQKFDEMISSLINNIKGEIDFKVEIDAIQIGGNVKYINKKKFKHITCNVSNIDMCINYTFLLSRYFKLYFPNQLISKDNITTFDLKQFVPLVRIDQGKAIVYIDSIDNDYSNYFISQQYRRYYSIYNYLKRLYELYPIKLDEIRNLCGKVKNYIDIMYYDKKKKNDELDYEIASFIFDFNFEKYYEVHLNGSYCLGSSDTTFTWEKPVYIRLYWNPLNKDEITHYIESNLFKCKFIGKENGIVLECEEDIIKLRIIIIEDNLFICENLTFGIKEQILNNKMIQFKLNKYSYTNGMKNNYF